MILLQCCNGDSGVLIKSVVWGLLVKQNRKTNSVKYVVSGTTSLGCLIDDIFA